MTDLRFYYGALSAPDILTLATYPGTHPPQATITLGNLAQTYDGAPEPVAVTTVPPGLTVNVTYNGSTNVPVNAGSYNVLATVIDPTYVGSATNTLVISQAPAVVSLGNLFQMYDGTAKAVSVTTSPADLAVSLTYDGSANAPTNIGSYTVIGAVSDANYQGSATNTLVIYGHVPVHYVALTNLNPVPPVLRLGDRRHQSPGRGGYRPGRGPGVRGRRRLCRRRCGGRWPADQPRRDHQCGDGKQHQRAARHGDPGRRSRFHQLQWGWGPSVRVSGRPGRPQRLHVDQRPYPGAVRRRRGAVRRRRLVPAERNADQLRLERQLGPLIPGAGRMPARSSTAS